MTNSQLGGGIEASGLKNNVKFCSRDPGGMMNEEFLAEYGLPQNQLAKTIGNPAASVDCGFAGSMGPSTSAMAET